MWLRATIITSRVRGQRPEEAVVDRGVGVLLRVEHPDQQVGQLDQPLDLEVVRDLGGVVVGQVEQDQPSRSRVRGRCRASSRAVTWCRFGMPSQSSSSRAVGAPGAGRGPRRGRPAYPDRGELEPGQGVEQRGLPEPVAPASATTVCSLERRAGRRPARRRSAAASTTRRPAVRGAASTAWLSPRRARPRPDRPAQQASWRPPRARFSSPASSRCCPGAKRSVVDPRASTRSWSAAPRTTLGWSSSSRKRRRSLATASTTRR